MLLPDVNSINNGYKVPKRTVAQHTIIHIPPKSIILSRDIKVTDCCVLNFEALKVKRVIETTTTVPIRAKIKSPRVGSDAKE